jgi:hypothetical protein
LELSEFLIFISGLWQIGYGEAIFGRRLQPKVGKSCLETGQTLAAPVEIGHEPCNRVAQILAALGWFSRFLA